ncbi:hypothetical protein BH11CYA1_BH11CYA1_03220 [soil metagenome]
MHPTVRLVTDAMTVAFFLVTLSYYVLLFYKPKRRKTDSSFDSVTVIIPAHNEQRYIEACVESVLKAEYKGHKEIIVVDDGSSDATAAIVSAMVERPGIQSLTQSLTLISQPHTGKAATLNMAIARATGQLVAIIDGDTEIEANALVEMQKDLEQEKTAATTCPIAVKNRDEGVLMWVHVEQLYASLLRSIMTKVNANVINSGQCGMFRKKELVDCGGFSTFGLSEDMDVAIRLVRAGYHLSFTEGTMAYTNMPESFTWFCKQRARWARGGLNNLMRHMRLNTNIIDLYSMPLVVFGYIQALVMGAFTLYKIVEGYIYLYITYGHFFNWRIILFLLEWCSALGMLKWTLGFFTGVNPLTAVNIMGALASLLSYPLFLFAIVKFDRKIDLYHIIPLMFMAPLWWMVMLIQALSLPELFNRNRYNIWSKPCIEKVPAAHEKTTLKSSGKA